MGTHIGMLKASVKVFKGWPLRKGDLMFESFELTSSILIYYAVHHEQHGKPAALDEHDRTVPKSPAST